MDERKQEGELHLLGGSTVYKQDYAPEVLGVKWGSVPTSATKTKRNGGHTWFPDSWDDDKIVTEMYKVKNGKSEFIMDKVNDDGKLLG